jgi:transposase-like protein
MAPRGAAAKAGAMRKPYERSERAALIRAVQHGEAVATAASRLGVGMSTAYRWVRAAPTPRSAPGPVFIEVVPERERAGPPNLRVRVGVAEVEVTAGFDARLLRAVVEALGGEA